MRIVFFDSDYPALLGAVYGGRPQASLQEEHDVLLARRNAAMFARLDFVADALAKIGHTADVFYLNNLPLQLAWARKHGRSVGLSAPALARLGTFWLRRLASGARIWSHRLLSKRRLAPQPDPLFDTRNPRVYELAAEQISKLRPDVVYNHDPALVDGARLKSTPGFTGKLVAQIASPYPDTIDWRPYDLVISSLPNFVERFRAQGVPAAYLPLYFAPQVQDEVPPRPRDLPLTFVGSVTPVHAGRRKFLERIADCLPLDLYGSLYGEPQGSVLAKAYRGPAWGRDMYVTLARSQLTLNRHIDVAEGFANNLRLYEATGMGACLVTEQRENLPDLFELGREVLAYGSTEECIEMCRYYMSRPREAAAIGAAGQRRCLADHTVERHAEKLAAILGNRL
jgi:spore maturation protein CgeB